MPELPDITVYIEALDVSGQGDLAQQLRWAAFEQRLSSIQLRAYLKKWSFEVGTFFAGVGPNSSDDELRQIGPDHPVFRLTPRPLAKSIVIRCAPHQVFPRRKCARCRIGLWKRNSAPCPAWWM